MRGAIDSLLWVLKFLTGLSKISVFKHEIFYFQRTVSVAFCSVREMCITVAEFLDNELFVNLEVNCKIH